MEAKETITIKTKYKLNKLENSKAFQIEYLIDIPCRKINKGDLGGCLLGTNKDILNNHINDTSVIKKGTIVFTNIYMGNNTEIGNSCFIGEHVKIGSNVKIGNEVNIEDGVTIGNNVTVLNGTNIPANTKIPNMSIVMNNKEGDLVIH